MKKLYSLCVLILLLSQFALFSHADLQNNSPVMDSFRIEQFSGYVDIVGNTIKTVKILVQSPNQERIWYKPLYSEGMMNNRIWLTQGTGKYTISVMENLHDNLYTYMKTWDIINATEVDKYLMPSKEIESDNIQIKTLSANLTANCVTDSEKAIKIYDWVSTNIRYDLSKFAKMIRNDYSSNYGALATLNSGKGVCYDYSTLYAALGRACGLRVKVITGNYKSQNINTYHAWNDVYVSDLGRWISLDASMGFVYQKVYYDNLDMINNYEKTGEIT